MLVVSFGIFLELLENYLCESEQLRLFVSLHQIQRAAQTTVGRTTLLGQIAVGIVCIPPTPHPDKRLITKHRHSATQQHVRHRRSAQRAPPKTPRPEHPPPMPSGSAAQQPGQPLKRGRRFANARVQPLEECASTTACGEHSPLAGAQCDISKSQ